MAQQKRTSLGGDKSAQHSFFSRRYGGEAASLDVVAQRSIFRCAGAPRPTRPSCLPSGEAARRTREVEKPLPQLTGPIVLAPTAR
mmetsp:Transcript_43453/g.94648  ORF Transcript_43453/g.94648 Transcript_43453/m.94648 type:complete len:85 (-) Transcript_43453:107-361(-)